MADLSVMELDFIIVRFRRTRIFVVALLLMLLLFLPLGTVSSVYIEVTGGVDEFSRLSTVRASAAGAESFDEVLACLRVELYTVIEFPRVSFSDTKFIRVVPFVIVEVVYSNFEHNLKSVLDLIKLIKFAIKEYRNVILHAKMRFGDSTQLYDEPHCLQSRFFLKTRLKLEKNNKKKEPEIQLLERAKYETAQDSSLECCCPPTMRL